MHWLSRTELLIGNEAVEKLQNARVLIVGMGGVGSYCAEYIARAGVGKLTIVDGDTIEMTNRNRQLPALVSSEGESKAGYMEKRIKDINPDAQVTVIQAYMVHEKLKEILSEKYDYAIDCIDTISPKLAMIRICLETGTRFVSSMGAGGKLNPERIRIVDIWETYNCPFAQHIRKTLRKWGIKQGFKAVFSDELHDKKSLQNVEGQRHKKSYYGTISYMPSLFGAFCASVAIRDLIEG